MDSIGNNQNKARILEAIIEYAIKWGGLTPTTTMIASKTGLSVTTVSYYKKLLIDDGLLDTDSIGRIVILGGTFVPPKYYLAEQEEGNARIEIRKRRPVRGGRRTTESTASGQVDPTESMESNESLRDAKGHLS